MYYAPHPLKDEYPYYTSYQYAGNKPINSIDVDGLEAANQVEDKETGQQQSKLNSNDVVLANKIATDALDTFGNNTGETSFGTKVFQELLGIDTEAKTKRTENTKAFLLDQASQFHNLESEQGQEFVSLLTQIYNDARYLSRVNPDLAAAYNEAIASGTIDDALGFILGRSLEVSKRQEEFFALSLIVIAYGAAFPVTAGAGAGASSRGFFVTTQRFQNNLLTKVTPESLAGKATNFETISSAEVLEQVITRGQADRVIGNYSIDLIANRSGNKYIINGFNVNLRAGASESVSGIKSVLAELESEALASGANKFVFRLHAVRNPGFASERLWNLLGYSFKNEGGNIITATKLLK